MCKYLADRDLAADWRYEGQTRRSCEHKTSGKSEIRLHHRRLRILEGCPGPATGTKGLSSAESWSKWTASERDEITFDQSWMGMSKSGIPHSGGCLLFCLHASAMVFLLRQSLACTANFSASGLSEPFMLLETIATVATWKGTVFVRSKRPFAFHSPHINKKLKTKVWVFLALGRYALVIIYAKESEINEFIPSDIFRRAREPGLLKKPEIMPLTQFGAFIAKPWWDVNSRPAASQPNNEANNLMFKPRKVISLINKQKRQFLFYRLRPKSLAE